MSNRPPQPDTYPYAPSTGTARKTTRTTALSLAIAFTLLPLNAMSDTAAKPTSGPTVINTATPAVWPALKWPLPDNVALEKRIDEVMTKLTVEEKVGQIVQADIGSVTPAEAKRYHLGSILAGGNSDPGGKYNATIQEWLALADAFYNASIDKSGGRAGVPILFGIDAVHGHNNVVGATIFPHNIGLGATNNPALIRQIAEVTAKELRLSGAEWTFGPTLTVPQDDRWGRSYEGYSEDPELVAKLGREVVLGLQGEVGSADFLSQSRVLATSKHFLADGGTIGGKDQGDALISEKTLINKHARGYYTTIEAGVQSVMASFSSWNGSKLHGNTSLLTDVLRGPLAFDGFVVGDWNAHGQVPGCTNDNCPAAFNAGVDMLMAPDSWRGYYDNALKQVKSGEISMARLDQAVRRILRAKFRIGLFDQGAPSKRALGGKFELLGSPAHRAVARQAVRESLVLLKNQNNLLPLNPASKVLVAGDGADNFMKQSGGWTLTWQGSGLKPEDFPNAQTVWGGIREKVQAAGGKAMLSVDGSFTEKPDVAVVVFGEDPYAEFVGDIPTLAYRPGNDTDLELMRKLKAAGIPVVSVFFSGRPLSLNREINASDAFIAAWLPGSEGGGIADVLLRKADGSIGYDFKGKLSFSWPRHSMHTPLNVDDAVYDPQFAFGYGLTYKDNGNLPMLVEETPDAIDLAALGIWFNKGRLATNYEFVLEPADAASTPIRLSKIDRNAQEDARRIEWLGASSPASAAINSAKGIDVDRQTNADVLLVLDMRIDQPLSGELFVEAASSNGKTGRVSITPAIKQIPAGQWKRVGIALKCLRTAGASMNAVTVPMRLISQGKGTLSISSIALSTDYDIAVDCKRN